MNKVKIDWDKLIEKSIVGKVENIFEALKWDLSGIKEIKIKKPKKEREGRQIDSNKEEER